MKKTGIRGYPSFNGMTRAELIAELAQFRSDFQKEVAGEAKAVAKIAFKAVEELQQEVRQSLMEDVRSLTLTVLKSHWENSRSWGMRLFSWQSQYEKDFGTIAWWKRELGNPKKDALPFAISYHGQALIEALEREGK